MIARGLLYTAIGTCAVLGGFAVTQSPLIAASTMAAVVGLLLVAKLGSWRGLWLVTLALITLATVPPINETPWVELGRFIAVAVLAVVTWWWNRPNRLTLSALVWPARWIVRGLWGVTVVAFASTLWSVEPVTTLQQSVALLLLVLLLHMLATRRWTDTTLIAGDLAVMLVVLTVVCVASLLGSELGLIADSRSYTERLQGVTANPNTLAAFAVFGALLAWGLARHYRRHWILLTALPCLAALLMTESRTSVVALVVAFVVVSLRDATRGITRFAYIAVMAGLIVFVAAPILGWQPPAALQQTSDRFTEGTDAASLNDRTLAWASALRYWGEQPLSGVGYQAGEDLFTSEYESGSLAFQRAPAHNSYLQLLLELGLLGAIPALLALIAVVMAWLRSSTRGLGAGTMAVVLAGLIIQISESSMLGTGQLYPYVFWPVALGVGLMPKNAPPETKYQPDRQLVAS